MTINYNNVLPCKVDPFVGIWGDFFASSGALGRRLFVAPPALQQAHLQQQDARRLLEAHQAGGADGCWIQLMELLMLVAHVLTTQAGYKLNPSAFGLRDRDIVLGLTLIIKFQNNSV